MRLFEQIPAKCALALLLTCTISGSCAVEPEPQQPARIRGGENSEATARLKESVKAWESWLQKHGGEEQAYVYTRKGKRMYAPFKNRLTTTRITVKNGKVISRQYQEMDLPGAPEAESFTEGAAAVGSHKLGAPPRTMEQLYAEAMQLAKKHGNKPGFSLKMNSDGVIRSCQWIDRSIADHAPVHGFAIQKLTSLADRSE